MCSSTFGQRALEQRGIGTEARWSQTALEQKNIREEARLGRGRSRYIALEQNINENKGWEMFEEYGRWVLG